MDKPSLLLIDFGEAALFVTGKFPQYFINPPVASSSVGTFPVTITLTDNHPSLPEYATYYLNLVIQDSQGLLVVKETTTKETIPVEST